MTNRESLLTLTGKEIIQTLKEDYNEFEIDDTMFEEWVSPVDLSVLEDDKEYFIDGEISFKPILVEELGLNNSVSSDNIASYFSNVIMTNNQHLSYYIFSDIEEYINIEEIESIERAFTKLTDKDINIDEPFVELLVGQYEFYINIVDLNTESKILKTQIANGQIMHKGCALPPLNMQMNLIKHLIILKTALWI